MLDDYTCVVTGHSPPFVFDLRDGHLSQLARPTVQDLLEYAAEHHHVHCPCGLKIGGRAWYTSVLLSEAADCEWETVARDPLSVNTSLDALPGATVPSTVQLVLAGEQSSSTDYLRLYRERLFTSCRVEGAVAYKRLGASYTSPSEKGTSFAEMCSTPGSVFVDKTNFVRAMLSQLAYSRVNIIRRPRGFGKTTFLSMFDAYFDPLSAHAYFPFTFTEDMSKPIFAQRGQLLIYALDFADLSFNNTMGYYALEAECDRFLDNAGHKFYLRYQHILSGPEEEMFDPDASATFIDILRWAQLDNWQLCFTVDNYTAPLLDGPCLAYEEAISLHIFRHLCNLLCDRVISYGLIVGDDLPDNTHWNGLPDLFTDLSSSPAFSEAIGFSLADVAALGRATDVDLLSALPLHAPTGSIADARNIYASADVLSLARQALCPGGLGQRAQVEVRAITVPPPVVSVEHEPLAIRIQRNLERIMREIETHGSHYTYPEDVEFLSEGEEDGEDDSIVRSPGMITDTSSSGTFSTSSSGSSSTSNEKQIRVAIAEEPSSPLEAYGKKPWGSD